MALIKCPDCGKDISDKADKCPFCGCPVVSSSIRIKLGQLEGVFAAQNVSIIIGGKEVWKGKSGETVVLDIKEKTEVTIKYGLTMKYLPGSCKGVIDPAASSRYYVQATSGFAWATVLRFQMEDLHVS